MANLCGSHAPHKPLPPTVYEIFILQALDYETATNHSYNFTVEARNVNEDFGSMMSTTAVIVYVTDINEPPLFDLPTYTFSGRGPTYTDYFRVNTSYKGM